MLCKFNSDNIYLLSHLLMQSKFHWQQCENIRTARADSQYCSLYERTQALLTKNNSACTIFISIFVLCWQNTVLQRVMFSVGRLGMKNEKTFCATRSSDDPNPAFHRIGKVRTPNILNKLKNYYVIWLCEKNKNCVKWKELINPQNSFSLLLTLVKATLKDACEG